MTFYDIPLRIMVSVVELKRAIEEWSAGADMSLHSHILRLRRLRLHSSGKPDARFRHNRDSS
jgi:hypothetical protein